MSLFQSNLRKQLGKLPKILKSVKIIHYYSLLVLFIRVLRRPPAAAGRAPARGRSPGASGRARAAAPPARPARLGSRFLGSQ